MALHLTNVKAENITPTKYNYLNTRYEKIILQIQISRGVTLIHVSSSMTYKN